MKLLALFAAAGSLVAADRESELRFRPDPGIRIDDASNPAARVDESDFAPTEPDIAQ